MFRKNEINKVAIIAAGNVNHHILDFEGDVLNVPESIELTRAMVTHSRRAIEKKGFEVVYAEPVAVGINCTGWWVMEPPGFSGVETETYVAPDNSYRLIQVPDGRSVYKFENLAADPTLYVAASGIMGEIERRSWSSYKVNPEDARVVQKATGADTLLVIFNRSKIQKEWYERKRERFFKEMSFFEKLGANMVLLVMAPYIKTYSPNDDDYLSFNLAFLDLSKNVVLWETMGGSEDPSVPDESKIERALKFFPEKGKLMNPDVCKRDKDGDTRCKN